jgi:hypothetical protein
LTGDFVASQEKKILHTTNHNIGRDISALLMPNSQYGPELLLLKILFAQFGSAILDTSDLFVLLDSCVTKFPRLVRSYPIGDSKVSVLAVIDSLIRVRQTLDLVSMKFSKLSKARFKTCPRLKKSLKIMFHDFIKHKSRVKFQTQQRQ